MKKSTLIAATEFIDRFIYYGYLSVYILLAIALTHSPSEAIKLYGLYGTFGFSLPTVIAYFSDKWEQHYSTALLGLALFLCTPLMLMLKPHHQGFILSSVFLLIGIGCFKSNNLKIFNDCGDQHTRFTLYYAFMTAGSIVGPLVFGYYFNAKNITIALTMTAIIASSSLILYSFIFQKIICKELKSGRAPLMFASTLTIYSLTLASYYYSSIYTIYLLTLTAVVLLIFKQINLATLRKKLIALLLFSTIFFTLQMLTSGIVLLYIKTYVGNSLYGITIPLPYFIVILPVVSVLLSFGLSHTFLAAENKIKNLYYYKLLVGGFISALAILLMLLSHRSNQNLNILIIFLSLFLLGIADFLVAPSILFYLGKFGTHKIKSTLYSLWFMSIALSFYLNIKLFNLGNYFHYIHHGGYIHYFIMFLLSALLMLAVMPFIKILKSE